MNYKNLLLPVFFASVITSCNNPAATEKKDDTTAAVSKKDSIRYVRVLDNEALNLIDSSAEIEVIADGFKWSEGPLYITDSNYLLFSDVPANQIYKWRE